MSKSTSAGKNVATTKTDHKSVAAPQTSLCPPPPPGAPVPTPFNTSSVTSSAKSTASVSTFGGAEAVTDGSSMETQSPGNQQSLPVLIWGLLRRGIDPTVNALATVVLFSLVALVILSSLLSRRRS